MSHGQRVAGSSVWRSAQRTAQAQRKGRYLPESRAHPGKMLPAIAAQAIATYTQPGDLVLDPMCGSGTTLIEAIHQRRDAIGIEYEPDWARLAQANIRHAQQAGATGHANVISGDARTILPRLRTQMPQGIRPVQLVVTSPPYGPSVHGQVNASGVRPVAKSHDRYSHDPHNLAHQSHDRLIDGFADILTGCRQLLAPEGVVAVTTRPYRRGGLLVDIPGAVIRAAHTAGLQFHERLVCLLAGIDAGRLIPRASFFQLHLVRDARRRGNPLAIIAHEDLLIFRAADKPT